MQKQFTYPVPDELYIDSFTTNTHATWTYNGPEKLYLHVEEFGPVINISTVPFDNVVYDASKIKEIVLDANTFPEVAMYLTNLTDDTYTRMFRTVTNDDGSTHEEISNPRINDYYTLSYHDGIENPWKFFVITKDMTSPGEDIARLDLEYVKKYADKYVFETEDQKAIDDFIKSLKDYIAVMAPRKPWRFESYKETRPKMPIKLINLFNSLPKE